MAPKNNKRLLKKKGFLQRTKKQKKINTITEIETTASLEDSTDNLRNIANFNKKSLKMDVSKKDRIDILGEILILLKSENYKKNIKSTLQSIFKLLDIEDRRKRDINWILTTFINNLKDLNAMQDLTPIAEDCFDLLFPETLLNILTTENDNIKEGLLIGFGGFGRVTKGSFCRKNGSEIVVAVKSPININYKIGIRREAIILSQLSHPNIVKLIAYRKKPSKLVMEFMQNRSLKDVLMSDSIDTNFQRCFYKWIIEILSAMEYISDRQIVHRDLGTKNIFVNSKMCCKVGDFGLSCFVGYTKGVYVEKIGELRGYNVSPESKLTQHFTTKSDVWAMGLLIWEMYLIQNSTVFYSFESELIGSLLFSIFKCPPNCPRGLFNYIIHYITNDDPHSRPSFKEIKEFVISHENVFFN